MMEQQVVLQEAVEVVDVIGLVPLNLAVVVLEVLSGLSTSQQVQTLQPQVPVRIRVLQSSR